MVSSFVTCTHNRKPFLLTFPSPLQSPNPQMYLMKQHFKTYFHSVWPKHCDLFFLCFLCVSVCESASNCQCVQIAAVPQSEVRYHKLWVLTAGSLLLPPSVPAAHTCTWTWGHLIQAASVWLWKQQVTKPNQRRCRLKKRWFNQNQPIIAEEP